MNGDANIKNNSKYTVCVIVVMLLLSSVTAITHQTILSYGIVLCCACLFFRGDLVYAFPVILFYNELLGIVFGMSVLRIYTLMLLFGFLFQMRKNKKIEIAYLVPISVYLFFLVSTMAIFDLRRAVFAFIDVICCTILVLKITKEKGIIKKLFTVYILVAICSFITGMLGGNTVIHGDVIGYQYARLNATFEDPNYMGFFFNIAIFAAVSLKLFKPKLRFVIVLALYIMMLTSVSMTAIVVNIVVWMIYLFVAKKIKAKTLLLFPLIVLLIVNVYTYGISNPDAPIIGAVSYRVEEKLNLLQANEINKVTTGRVDLSKENWEYFNSLPLFNQLFGGTSVTSSYLHPDLRGASHNDYIDMLLNVGYIGEFFMLAFLAWRFGCLFKQYRAEKNEETMCLIMTKCIWVLYAVTLTMFLDYRFLFVYLL